MQDIERVKSNISKMIDMEAPEADIDAYLSEEGLSAADLQPKPHGRGEGGFQEKAEAVLRGVADVFTFGQSDEISAGINSVLPVDKLTGADVGSIWDGMSLKDAYNKNLDTQRSVDKYDERENFGYRLAGQLPAALATGVLTGGASLGLRGLATAATEGAAYGFGSGENTFSDRAQKAGVGALGGALGFGLGRGISKTLSPTVDKGARQLIDEGIPLTPGQIMGGVGKTVEDKLTSIPFVGDAIQASRGRGIEAFNKAAVNRSLKPLGKKLPENIKAGYEAIEYAQNALSKAYNDLLPDLKVKVDGKFLKEFDNLKTLASEMPKERVGQFNKIVERQILSRLSKNGSMTGEAMKEAESELGRLVRNYSKSMNGDERLLGDALRETQSQLRDLVARSNPSKALELKSINKGFATLLRPESAASKAKSGIFTPAQLQTATRILDSSGRKKVSARGGALMQDLAETARDILPSSIPDSGTAGRLLLTGGSAYASTSDNNTLQTLGALGLLGSGAYTKTGQKAIQKILTDRPDLISKMGAYVPQQLGLTGGLLATNAQ